MKKRAIVLGATGLTGSFLLDLLLEDERYGEVLVIGRSSCKLKHPKLNEILTDLSKLEELAEQFNGDVVFCCIGTTKAKTKDEDEYRKIDKGIPITAAKLAKQNGIDTFIVISAIGANPGSRIFYNAVKGEMEDRVLYQKIKNTYILQPSLIKGRRQNSRIGETVANIIMTILRPIMFGDLKKYKPIAARTVALCMIWLDNNPYPEKRILSNEIKKMVNLK